jgi:hypothetical protein
LADQLDGEWRELAQQLARTPAKTADGLIAKLAPVVAPHAEDDEDGTNIHILASAVRDAMGTKAPLTANML